MGLRGGIHMNYDDQQKTITTNRLVLRLFEKSDAEAVARLCNNYNLYKNTLYLPYPYALEDALSWMERHLNNFNEDKSYEFAVTDKDSGEVYGAIALSNNKRFHHGEIAYWIGEEFWGNGYATEAAEAVLKFAFEVKQYHKVFARYFSSNPASGRVMQKLGMKEEGILIDHVWKENRYENLVCYGIINSKEC
jgi:[ribosomal protein S5]-alanine N-acetyltransferase